MWSANLEILECSQMVRLRKISKSKGFYLNVEKKMEGDLLSEAVAISGYSGQW